MIVTQHLAAEIERAEGGFIAACGRATAARTGGDAFQVPLAGGVAVYAGPDSPFNKVAGAGFAGVPSDPQLAEIESRYADLGAPVSFEISTLADPELFEWLSTRGYRLVSFEDVLVSQVGGDVAPPGDGIEIHRVLDDFTEWLRVAVESSLTPDTAGVPWHETFPREAMESAERAGIDAGACAYLATMDGDPAGSGGLAVAGRIAQLTGAGTLPMFRRRGVQGALLGARLGDAHAAGCEVAVVTTQPGSTSQANVRRAGFELGYARAVLVKDGAAAR